MKLNAISPLATAFALMASLAAAQDIHGGGATPRTETPEPTGAAPTEAMTTLDGAYTEEQAERGRTVALEHCANCHGGNLRGLGTMGPSIVGSRFERRWEDMSALDLFDYLKVAMPKDDPGRLRDTEYADVLAYLLYRSSYPAGTDIDIPVDPAALELITIVALPDEG